MGFVKLDACRKSCQGLASYNPLTCLKMTKTQSTVSFSAPKWLNGSLLVLLLILFLGLRLPGLGRFGTIDEVYWLNNSAQFFQAVADHNWAGTGVGVHPGVTTMWAGTLGFLWRFPQFAQAHLPVITDFHLRHYLAQHSINPVELVAAGRTFAVLFNAAAFLIAGFYLFSLLGNFGGSLAMALVALDPFLIAHQRLLHQDGLMASFGLLSLVAFAAFLKSQRNRDLLISAIAAGLAWLTKSPMLALLPVVGLAGGLAYWNRGSGQNKGLGDLLIKLGTWTLVAVTVFIALWPAMWVHPLESLKGVLGYALGSASGEFSGPIFFNGNIYPDGNIGLASAVFYPLTFLWRASPPALLGLLAALFYTIRRRTKNFLGEKFLLPIAALFAILFTLAMSVAAKKFDRYFLPAYISLLPLAAWGLVRLTESAQTALRSALAKKLVLLAPALFLGAQLIMGANVFPYYLSYYNPLLGGAAQAQNVMMLGWGEGLEKAAQYLRARPGIETKSIAAWYSNLFDLFYPRDVDDIPIAVSLSSTELTNMLAHDYLVIYVHQWQRGTPQNLLDALANLQPEYSAVINGIEYVRVYHLEH